MSVTTFIVSRGSGDKTDDLAMFTNGPAELRHMFSSGHEVRPLHSVLLYKTQAVRHGAHTPQIKLNLFLTQMSYLPTLLRPARTPVCHGNLRLFHTLFLTHLF